MALNGCGFEHGLVGIVHADPLQKKEETRALSLPREEEEEEEEEEEKRSARKTRATPRERERERERARARGLQVFAYGMRAQCEAVASAVRAVHAVLGARPMQLNVVGLSRGAVAALAIAAMIGEHPGWFVGGTAEEYELLLAAEDAQLREAGCEESAQAEEVAAQKRDAWLRSSAARACAREGAALDEAEVCCDDGGRFTDRSSGSSCEEAAQSQESQRDEELGSSAVDWLQDRTSDLVEYCAGWLEPGPVSTPRRHELLRAPPSAALATAEGRSEQDSARRALASLARCSLRCHLLLFDPVPGNLISTTQLLDPYKYSTGNSAVDVTNSGGVLRRVLAIYPYEPLPAFTFHAPLIATYPADCVVDEVASLGCHQGALLCAPNRISCRLSYTMLRSFLASQCNVTLRDCLPFDKQLATQQSTLRVLERLRSAAILDALNHGATPNSRFVTRPAHALTPNAAVVRNSNGLYFNLYHHRLAKASEARGDDDQPLVHLPDEHPDRDPHVPLYLLDVVR